MLRISVNVLAVTFLLFIFGANAVERQAIPVERQSIPVERGRMPIERGSIPVERGRIPIERGRIPIERGNVPVEQGTTSVQQGGVEVNQAGASVKRGKAPAKQSASAQASQRNAKACLAKGSFTFFGKTTEIEDCIQNDGVSHKQFIQQCESTVKIGNALGIKLSELSYMAKCPANPKGVCKNMAGGKLSGYYYKRDKASMVGTKDSCIKAGGTWSRG